MDKQTRQRLKTDKFVTEVGHSVEYVAGHQRQMLIYGGAGLAVVLAIFAWVSVSRSNAAVRQLALGEALQLKESMVGTPPPADPRKYFPTTEEKSAAIEKAFTEITTKHAGSNESAMAHFQLAAIAVDKQNLADAEKHFREAAKQGDAATSSAARLALGQMLINEASGPRHDEGEKLLRELLASPTVLVSKEQASIALARGIAASKPDEAMKLLEPFKADATRPNLQRAVEGVLAQIPAKK